MVCTAGSVPTRWQQTVQWEQAAAVFGRKSVLAKLLTLRLFSLAPLLLAAGLQKDSVGVLPECRTDLPEA